VRRFQIEQRDAGVPAPTITPFGVAVFLQWLTILVWRLVKQ